MSIREFLPSPIRTGFKNLKYCASKAKINGYIQEFGVAGGRTISELSKYFPNETVWGFDSFEGLPHEWERGKTSIVPKGVFRRGELPIVPNNVKLVKGLFNETLSTWLDENTGDIKFVHIDCDLYDSTKTVLELLNDRIKKGTVIVFDELYSWNDHPEERYESWEKGEWKALKEWMKEYGRKIIILGRNNREAAGIMVCE